MFLRKITLKCELFFLTLWASIVCVVWGGPSISPSFALLGHPTTFQITDVEHPYTICTTTFPDSKRQALYAQVGSRDSRGQRSALCVIDAPEMSPDVYSVDALVKISGAAGPRGKLQPGDEYVMRFVQPPTILHSDVQYVEDEKPGYYVWVFLQGANGMKQVKEIAAALKLELDMSVIGLRTVSLSGSLEFFKNSAQASFRLPQLLPNGRYPCVMSISGHPVRLAQSRRTETESGPQTRAQARFNSSDTAEAVPLLQPVEDHTFMVSVGVPTVVLAPPAVSVSDLSDCDGEQVHDDCEGADGAGSPVAARSSSNLWLSLHGEQVHGSVSALLAISIGKTTVTEAAIIAAVRERDVLVSTDEVVLLPQPSVNHEGITLLWVQWDEVSSPSRRLLFDQTSESYPEEGYFVRVFRAIAASVDQGMQSAWVAPPGVGLPGPPPVFSVHGQLVVHRGENVSFHMKRHGPPSERESRVLWRLVYLDPASKSELALGVGDMLSDGTGWGKGVDALKRSGTVHWLPGDAEKKIAVNVPVAWDAVPYSARWMLAVRLSARQNGAVVSTDLQAPPAPSAQTSLAVAPSPQHLTDQMNGIMPVVAGDTESEATAVNAIMYGAPAGTCPPSMARVAGSAAEPPVALGLSSTHAVRGISLQVAQDAALGAERSFVQTTPTFDGRIRTYSVLVPYSTTHAAVAVSASVGEALFLQGCGITTSSVAPQMFNATFSPGVVHHVWPVQKPAAGPKCTTVVRSCSASHAAETACSRGARTDTVLVHWLDNSSLARIESVNVTVGSQTGQVCSSRGAEAVQACRSGSAVRPASDSAGQKCAVSTCRPHAFVNTTILYHRGDTIKIAVQPKQSGRVASVSIGQRVFRASADGGLDRVSVSFKLFDASDRLSPFVPFFIRQRTHDRTMLDVPIMLALADGVTAVPYTLLLDIAVLPRGGATLPSQPLAEPSIAARNIGEPVSMEVVAESAHVSFLTDGVATAEAPIDVTAVPSSQRRLLDVSTTAPAHQEWLEDPLKNPQCEECPEGFFSNNVDVLCQRCSPGSCAPYPGMTACSTCPPGSHAPVYGASSCSPCVHGSYAQLSGSKACRLCPFGFTTTSDGAAVCDRAVEQTVALGKEYALAVSFSVRLMGMGFDDIPQRTGVLGSAEDILQFLVSLDSAAAFRVSTADVQVLSMTELKPRMLRINVTTNIAIDAPKKASDEELERAVSLAQLSKDAGIGNLTWDHTTEALGASAVTEDKVETEVIKPDPERSVSWKAIVMPIFAGMIHLSSPFWWHLDTDEWSRAALIILGSLLFLKIQRNRDHGLERVTHTPSMLIAQALGAVRAAMCPMSRRHTHHFSDIPSDVMSDFGDTLQVDIRPGDTGKRLVSSPDGIELNPRTNGDTRKRPVIDGAQFTQ